MGICLDTEPRPSSQTAFEERRGGASREEEGEDEESDDDEEEEVRRRAYDEEEQTHRFLGRGAVRPPVNPTIKFEPPTVPVIFVLGGPGSGKVTHCDALTTEKRGFVHINMTDLLQQFAVGNDMSDFNQLPSAAVTEVLMLEMKMAPSAKVYLISGFPRSMRDIAEYSEKIQVLSGAVLLSWRQKVLARQVEYGAKLGHVVLSLATMELRNFYRSVMPVADYLDQRGLLSVVDGERNPEEVYRDFRDVIEQLITPERKLQVAAKLAAHAAVIENPSTPVRHVAPHLGTVAHLPGHVPAHHQHNNNHHMRPVGGHGHLAGGNQQPARLAVPTGNHAPQISPSLPPRGASPPVIFVIGGPGSNKTSLCQRALRRHPDWGMVSLGRQLRAAAGAGGGGGGGKGTVQQQAALRSSIAAGEMAAQSVVLALLDEQIAVQSGARGILVAGFPRDLQQLGAFETQYKLRPAAVLLDCSKLQLGRGRLDDSVAAFRRRLELFRELTLPLLKRLDQQGRLSIVDGDTDSSAVLEDFCSILAGLMARAESGESAGGPPGGVLGMNTEYLPSTAGPHHQALLRDLNTGAHPGGSGGGVIAPSAVTSEANKESEIPSAFSNGALLNAPRRPSRDTIRNMYADLEEYTATS